MLIFLRMGSCLGWPVRPYGKHTTHAEQEGVLVLTNGSYIRNRKTPNCPSQSIFRPISTSTYFGQVNSRDSHIPRVDHGSSRCIVATRGVWSDHGNDEMGKHLLFAHLPITQMWQIPHTYIFLPCVWWTWWASVVGIMVTVWSFEVLVWFS